MKLSIRARLMIFFPILCAVLTLLMAFFAYQSCLTIVTQRMIVRLTKARAQHGHQIEQFLNERARLLSLIAKTEISGIRDNSEVTRRLRAIASMNLDSGVGDYLFLDIEGNILARSGPHDEEDGIEKAFLDQVVRGGEDHALVSGGHLGSSGKTEVAIALRLQDSDRVLLQRINLDSIVRVLADLSQTFTGIENSLLVNGEGRVLATAAGVSSVMPSYAYAHLPHWREALTGKSGFEMVSGNGMGEGKKVIAYGPLTEFKGYSEKPWILTVVIPTNRVIPEVVTLRNYLMVIGSVMTLLILLVAFRISRSILVPLGELVAATKKVGAGRFEQVPWKRGDEWGRIGGAFNEMVQSLQEITVSRGYLQAIFDTLKEGVLVADAAGRIRSVNAEAARIFGYKTETMIGKSIVDLMPEKFRSTHQKGMERYLRTGETHIIGKTVEVEGLKKDGSTFPMALTIADVSQEGEKLLIAAIRDVTDEKGLKADLERRVEELERFQRVTVGREKRIIELKEKIKELETERH